MFVCLRRGRWKGAQFDNVSITSMFVLRLRRERGKAQLVVNVSTRRISEHLYEPIFGTK